MTPDFSRTLQIQTAGLFTALIAVGAFISIPVPISPVPIVLQNFFVLLTGFFLAPFWAFLSVFVYLSAGAIGLPVFAGATGGLAHFAGPSGGYLISYIAVAPLVSLLSGTDRGRLRLAAAATVGVLCMYCAGVPRLAQVLELTTGEALITGALPFLPGDLVKIVLAVVVVRGVPESVWQNLRFKR